MTSKDASGTKGRVQGKEFVMRRVLDAPRELVCRAMTDLVEG